MSKTSKSSSAARSTGSADPSLPRQIGAFCYRHTDKGIEFLLITSSNGRWILPKGWPMPGKSKRKVAKIEAWEEAGVRKGKASKKPVLSFKADKQIGPKETLQTKVAVHTVAVKSLAKSFPEDDRRKRRWVTVDQAQTLVRDKKLRRAIEKLVTHVEPNRQKKAA